ncbi:hypothetical protein [Nocardiopsis chromatogenes]|uniref:hypothetical protein n=1 Tax=Nocardiopsis chromatogenes TaxID=280239 RepID=UPI00034892C7|nr:hypothetical protein [Nocardiopsis chromatogenes]
MAGGPSYRYPVSLEDIWWAFTVDEDGERHLPELWNADRQNVHNSCDARRFRHLALALLVAVPTAACLGACITIGVLV